MAFELTGVGYVHKNHVFVVDKKVGTARQFALLWVYRDLWRNPSGASTFPWSDKDFPVLKGLLPCTYVRQNNPFRMGFYSIPG
jgi:hypothetical protein